jgi:hypothetical protein
VHDDIWLVSFMDYDSGYFDLESRVFEPLENAFGPKCYPCLRYVVLAMSPSRTFLGSENIGAKKDRLIRTSAPGEKPLVTTAGLSLPPGRGIRHPDFA